MLVDYVLGKDSSKEQECYCELSYTNKDGMIEVEKVYFDGGFPSFTECDELDPDKIDIVSYSGKTLKYELKPNIKCFDVHHLLDNIIKYKNPELYQKYSQLNMPRVFSVDIETEITDEFGYSTPEKAENRILSISITSDNFNSLVLCVDDDKYEKLDTSDKSYINGILEESLGEFYHQREYNYNIKSCL